MGNLFPQNQAIYNPNWTMGTTGTTQQPSGTSQTDLQKLLGYGQTGLNIAQTGQGLWDLGKGTWDLGKSILNWF